MYRCHSNTTADVKQQLMFVGQESGKLLAVRDIIRHVRVCRWHYTDEGVITEIGDLMEDTIILLLIS